MSTWNDWKEYFNLVCTFLGRDWKNNTDLRFTFDSDEDEEDKDEENKSGVEDDFEVIHPSTSTTR